MASRSLLALLVAACLHVAAAGEPPREDTPAGPARRLVSVDDYLRAFDRSYEAPFAERDGLAAAEAAMEAALREAAPRLSLRERLDLAVAFPTLKVGVELEVPVFDATAEPRQAFAAADVELRTLYAAAAREAALAALLHDLAALAVLAPAARAGDELLADQALVRVDSVEPSALPANARGSYEAAVRALEAADWLANARADAIRRLARRLGLEEPSLSPPDPAELEAVLAAPMALASRRGSEEEAVDACLVGASAARIARARHAYVQRAAEHDAALDLSVTLTGRLDGELPLDALAEPSDAPGPAAVGSLVLEARLLLPPHWQLGGSIGAEVGTDGVSQELDLTWPRSGGAARAAYDPDSDLADELAMAADDARAYARRLTSARSARERSERALVWAVLDLAPHLPAAEAKSLASAPWGPAWQAVVVEEDLALVELRLEATLARLGELAAAIDLARHCGLLPPFGGG